MLTRMRAERHRRGWTQTDLGAKARLSSSDISRIECGRLRPYPQQLARLAKALGLRPEKLLDDMSQTAGAV